MTIVRRLASSGWLYLIGAIGSEVAGTLSLRGALDHPWLYLVVVAGFTAAFAFLTYVLRAGMKIGVAYGIWSACGVALTAIMSSILFSEPITPVMAVGMVLIMAGVLCIELGAQAGQKTARQAG